MKIKRAIGFGCTSGAKVESILELARATLGAQDTAGLIVATIDRHAEIAQAVAAQLGAKVKLFSADALSQVQNTTHESSLALAAVGTSSVAEAAALAALGARARLTAPRATGHHCTCAVAEIS